MPPKIGMLAEIPGDENVRPHPSAVPSTALLPHPATFPFHIIPGISNFRDVGGWSIPGNRCVRKGVLYRGSDTNKVTSEGVARLQELNIKTDFDLRSRQQIERTGGFRNIEGIKRIWTPVFTDEQYTEEAAKQRYELYAGEGTDGIVTAFIEILTSGTIMFRIVLRHLLATVPPATPEPASEPAPALFMHCTTGNNRTGVFISLLLLLLGVPESTVVEEYTLSEKGLAPTKHINVERLLKKGAFEEYGHDEARRKCERMVGARPESMWALIEEVKRRWGGPEGYFEEDVGLSKEEIERLKMVLTVKECK